MTDRLSAGGVDAVIVADPIHLGRGNAFAVAEQQFSSLGVRVEAASGDYTEPDYPVFGLPQLLDSMWVHRSRAMTKAKLTQMAADGYFTGGKVPFGLRAEAIPGVYPNYSKPPKRLVPDDTVVPVIRDAFDVYIKLSLVRATQDFLHEVTAETWSLSRPRRFLSNPVYEPIVGMETFQEVQRLFADKVTKKSRNT